MPSSGAATQNVFKNSPTHLRQRTCRPAAKWLAYFTPFFSEAERKNHGCQHRLFFSQVEYCDNLVFHKRAALDAMGERLLDAKLGCSNSMWDFLVERRRIIAYRNLGGCRIGGRAGASSPTAVVNITWTSSTMDRPMRSARVRCRRIPRMSPSP